jgi:hypothetical protein
MIRSPQQRRVAQQDTLALPVYIIEDLVRQRLKTNITRWVGGNYRDLRSCYIREKQEQ